MNAMRETLREHLRKNLIGATAWNWAKDVEPHIQERRDRVEEMFDWMLDDARTEGWDACASAIGLEDSYSLARSEDLKDDCPFRRPAPVPPDMEPEDVWELALKTAQARGWLSQTAVRDMEVENPFRRKPR